MADITLCSAGGRNAPDNGRAKMAVKTGKTGQERTWLVLDVTRQRVF
jgi:hypothetical protein